MDYEVLLHGVTVSIFSILFVFALLFILSLCIGFLRFLPQKKEVQSAPKAPVPAALEDDEEERMVAMLIASCLSKETWKGDVRVVSCERVK